MAKIESRYSVWRFAALTKRAVDHDATVRKARAKGRRGDAGWAGIIELLAAGGPVLPASLRAEELKAAFLDGAAYDAGSPAIEEVRISPTPRRRARTLVVGAAAALIITVLILSLGFASTYAMPGNPLYSTKRLVEKARVLLSPGGGSKASAYLASSNKRLEELEFVCEGSKEKWCYRIAQDAASDIEDAYHEADKTEGETRLKYRERARLAASTFL